MPRARCRQASDLLLACAGLLCLVLALASSGARADATEDVARVGDLSVEQQAQWLSRSAESGALAKLDDAQLVALFHSLDARTLPRYLQEGLDDFQSCEFTMRRRERIKGKWPKRADHMLVRVTREPLRIYAKWLPDGAHAGQEVIYDDSKRPDQLYGHLGGLLGVVPMWTSVNGALRPRAVESFDPRARHRRDHAALHRRRAQVRRSGHHEAVKYRGEDDRRTARRRAHV